MPLNGDSDIRQLIESGLDIKLLKYEKEEESEKSKQCLPLIAYHLEENRFFQFCQGDNC